MLRMLALLFAFASIWQTSTLLKVEGTFVESVSKMAFPERVGGWTRGDVTEVSWPGGYSVAYQLHENGITLADVTGYVFPDVPWAMPTRQDEHFALTVEMLLGLYPGAEVLDTKRERAIGRSGLVLRSVAVLRTERSATGGPSADAVYLQKEDGFWIKWRSTLPLATMDAVVPRVHALFDALIAGQPSAP